MSPLTLHIVKFLVTKFKKDEFYIGYVVIIIVLNPRTILTC